MIRNLRLKKIIVVFFLVLMITNVLAPSVSWALTSGPTAPEATSFEPVDTTDMVNLATGDFVYNLPLLEVPGPAGGYPLSLSYHAGIQPNEDASWVGLGWTLNPGSIARTVNGYPDDQLGAVRTRHDYKNGGTRNTFSVGVGIGGASLKLSVSNDSNLGVGVGLTTSIGASFGIGGEDSPLRIGGNFSIADDGYGNAYSGLSVGLSVGKSEADAKGLTGNIAVSTNFKSVSLSGGVGYGKSGSLVGGDISSNGLKPSMSVAGVSLSQINSAAGKVTTESWGISTPPIPIGSFTFTLGYNYLRYYSDETDNVNLIGSLKASATASKNPDTWAFDSYALLNPDVEGGVIKNNDPEKSKGGSFPAYDSYNVMAQGLGGSIQPYIFDNGTLFRQNLKTQDKSSYIIKYSTVNNSFNFPRPVQFRFKNDLSNSLTYGITSMITNGSSASFQGLISTSTPAQGYNQATSHLAGSKHIEYFTNQQIKDGTAKNKGFIDASANSSREITKYGYNVADQVGGVYDYK